VSSTWCALRPVLYSAITPQPQLHLRFMPRLSAMLHRLALRLLLPPLYCWPLCVLYLFVSSYLRLHTTPRIALHVNMRPILVSLPLLSLRFYVIVPPSYSISASFLTCTSSVSLPVCVMVSPLLGLFPVFGFKTYAVFFFLRVKLWH
jgi:hypothetical protein